ncbi:hypothetical protein [Rhizohabitans arisaemae]|uniref:hypothetical protein n=1 Tax=Rhizohabitans arisaemae TaxID=2720610 RepID=UPI0024B11119|nr:hypothetical protein [Rhizohabitans arisaemae]
MRVRRQVASLSASVLLAAGLVAGTAGPALAVPTGCSTWYSAGTYYSGCTGGTGEHRIAIMERHWAPGVGPIPSYGAWQPPGAVSQVWPRYGEVTGSWMERR